MTDYSRKRCVVCQRTGGITLQSDGIYECRNCGTPYRPRGRKAVAETTTSTQRQEDTVIDRFIWFTYTDESGETHTGLYDFPAVAERDRPQLHLDENKLKFYRHLHRTGRLGDGVDSEEK